MKLKYLIYTITLTSLTACSDFLEPKSQSKYIPKDANALQEMLIGEAYPQQGNTKFLAYLEILADDIDQNQVEGYEFPENEQGKMETFEVLYSWQPNMFEMQQKLGQEPSNTWGNLYEYILGEKVTKLGGTIAEIAAKYNMTPVEAVAFVDGINEALINPYDVNTLEENTVVELEIDFEKLYKKMVEYKADHLYSLPQWDNIFTEAQRKEMFLDQRNSKTIIKGAKVGRNDPCPCGSGKKYKHCCGKNQ